MSKAFDKIAAGLQEALAVTRYEKDGLFIYECEQLPGLYVADADDRIAYNKLPGVIRTIIRLEEGVDCEVAHAQRRNGRPEVPSQTAVPLVGRCLALTFRLQAKATLHCGIVPYGVGTVKAGMINDGQPREDGAGG